MVLSLFRVRYLVLAIRSVFQRENSHEKAHAGISFKIAISCHISGKYNHRIRSALFTFIIKPVGVRLRETDILEYVYSVTDEQVLELTC